MATDGEGELEVPQESANLEEARGTADEGVEGGGEEEEEEEAGEVEVDSEAATGVGTAEKGEGGEEEQDISEGSEGGWDTDLEIEEEKEEYDPTGASMYNKCCQSLGIVPVSHFIRDVQARQSEVTLRHHGLGPKGAKAIAVALTSNTSVTHLDLSDCGLEMEGGVAISTMLKENCYITQLDLSENSLGPPVAFAIASMVESNNTLTHLSLRGNGFKDKSAAPLSDVISKSYQVSYLDLSHNEFGEESGILFGAALAESEVLHTLDLSWNHIRKKGAVAIAAGLKSNHMLKVLNLSYNGLGAEGTTALADCLKVNTTLQDIDISNNRIFPESLLPLNKVLPSCEGLQVLKIGKNPLQKVSTPQPDGKPPPDPMSVIEALLEAAKTSSLQCLDLSGVTVTLKVADSVAAMKESHPHIVITHGGTGGYLRPKVQLKPIEKLVKYATENKLVLLDLFRSFDKDQRDLLPEEEFRNALKHISAPLKEFERLKLIKQFSKTLPPLEEGGSEIPAVDYQALVAAAKTEESPTNT